MTLITDVELREVLSRLRPNMGADYYRWKGSSSKLQNEETWDDVVEWTDGGSTKPTEQEMIDEYNIILTERQNQAIVNLVQINAKTQATNIPLWAGYTDTEALDYIDSDVIDLASAIVVIKALTQMLIALRNEKWPDLQNK